MLNFHRFKLENTSLICQDCGYTREAPLWCPFCKGVSTLDSPDAQWLVGPGHDDYNEFVCREIATLNEGKSCLGCPQPAIE